MVVVYGASDDLIEIEGDVTEEFDALAISEKKDGGLLAFSNGMIARIFYSSSGVWRIARVVGEFTIEQAPEDDEDNYSDRAHIPGEIQWVVLGTQGAWNK